MSHHNTKFWVAVFCLGLINARPSLGVEYTLQANAALRQDFTSNILLLPNALSPESVWGSDVDVQTSISARAPTWQASGSARFDNWFYYPLGGLDMQNQYINGNYSYLTERSRWELSGSYISDALLSSTSDPTIGIVLGRIRRDLATVSPSWSYQLTEYTKVGLSYSYNNSSYPSSSQNIGTIFPNSDTNSVSAMLTHQATEKLSLTGGLSGTFYSTGSSTTTSSFIIQPVPVQIATPVGVIRATVLERIPVTYHTNSNREINYLNFNTGLKYSPYNDVEIGASGGFQISQTTTDTTLYTVPASIVSPTTSRQIDTNPIQVGPLFDINAIKKFEKSTIGLIYGYQISPSLNGALYTSNHVSINSQHQFTQHLDGGMQLSYSENSFPYPGATPVNQSSLQIGANMSYKLMKNLAVSASYNYQTRTLSGGTYQNTPYNGTQDNHNVAVSLSYDFEQLHY